MNGYLRATEKILIGVYKRSESGLASMAKCSSMTVVDKVFLNNQVLFFVDFFAFIR